MDSDPAEWLDRHPMSAGGIRFERVGVEYDGAPSVTAKAGEALVEAVGVAHNGRNEGSEPVRLLVFTTGLEGRPNVSKAARPSPAPR